MNKKQLFYVFGEHTDVDKQCVKMGMKPCGEQTVSEFVLYDTDAFDVHTGTVNVNKHIRIDVNPYCGKFVSEFMFDDTKYICLSPHECYSGWEVTLMAMPCLSYGELIKVIESSKIYDEIVGSIGILLKDHTEKFIDYLHKTQTRKGKKIKKIIKRDIVSRSPYVSKMKRIIEICELYR